MEVRCPHCHTPVDLTDDSPLSDIACPSCGSSFSLLGNDETVAYEGATKTIGHFELIEQIGAGAFAIVWKARDTELDRTVAVKIPRKGQLDSTETEQFLREARAAAQLKHSNIVNVHEVGRDEDTVYIVSDYVEGLTLADFLTGRQISFREAAELCAKIADALHHAHEAGVIHRDLKPGNIVLDTDGEPHIMDFGLARREAGEVTMTVEGKVLGTPAYMSPEQAKGEAHHADRRTDVYSLGVILFELLTGEKPFRGNVRMLLHQVINEDAPSLRKLNRNIPRDLETICLKCLEKAPRKRYANARELAEELRRFYRGDPIQASPITTAARGWRWCRRNPVVASLATFVIILLMAGMAVASYLAFLAEKEAERRRRLLYASDMNLAGQALEQGNMIRTNSLLRRHVPGSLEEDLRGFEWYYLWREATARNPITILMDRAPVSIAFGEANGAAMFATAGYGGFVRLWTLGSGEPKNHRSLRKGKENDESMGVAFSHNGRWLVYSRGTGAGLALLDLATDEERVLQRSPTTRKAVAFSPDDEYLAIGCTDGRILLWSLATWSPEVTFPSESGDVWSLAYSPNGRHIAAGHSDGVITIWDRETSKITDTLSAGVLHSAGMLDEPKFREVQSLAFSPNGKLLAVGLNDKTVRVWNLMTGQETILSGHTKSVFSVTFSPDGKLIASCGASKVKLWDAGTLMEVDTLIGHSAQVTDVAFSPDGRTVGTVSMDYTARLWNIRQLRTPLIVQDANRRGPLAFFPDGSAAISISDGRLQSWDSITGRKKATNLDAVEDVTFFATSPVGRIALKCTNGIQIWDMTTRQKVATCLGEDEIVAGGYVEPMALSPDGSVLILGNLDGEVKMWDANTGDLLGVCEGHEHRVYCVAFSPDGKWVASGSFDETVRIWNVDTFKEERALVGHEDTVLSVVFSSDGRLVASGSFDNTVRVWRWTEVGSRTDVLTGHAASVYRVWFSEDGKSLITGSADHTVRFWDVDTKKQRFSLPASSRIFQLAVSPDGETLAGGHYIGSFRLWRAATEEEVQASGWYESE